MSEENVIAANPGKGLGITGFIISIVMITIGWWILAVLTVLLGPIGPVLYLLITILGLILSIIGRKRSKRAGFGTGLATTGMILSIITLSIWIIIVLVGGAMMSGMFR